MKLKQKCKNIFRNNEANNYAANQRENYGIPVPA